MTTEDESLRTFAARLFADPDEPPGDPKPAPEPDPTTGNVAPTEGGNPSPDEGDRDMRAFAAELFNRDH